MIDLHVHSNCSDGTLSPRELVDYAIKKNLTAFALTDHDTVDGLDELIEYAEELREKGIPNVPEVIPGIEFSTDYEGQDVHIVGLYINHKSEAFKSYLTNFINSREERNRKMCDNFVADGIDITYEELKSRFEGATITRAHVAALLLEKGYVKSRQEAFDKYIGDYCPYHFPREKVSPEMAIDLILEADGIPVLAHPILYHMSSRRLDALVSSLKERGLIGIEAVYSTYSSSEEREIRVLANKYHLLLSGGSDFHGSNKTNIDLGTGYGRLYVPDEYLEEIKLRRKNILFTDMDGTLLLNDSSVSGPMKQAIDKMTASGHQFVLTSGRPLPSMLEQKVKFKLNYRNMWIISNNGGIIYDCEKEAPLREIRLSSEAIDRIVKTADRLHIHVHSYTDTEIVGYDDDAELKYYRRRIHMPFVATDNIAAYLSDGAYKVQFIHLTDKSLLENAKHILEQEMGDEINVFFSNNQYLEILRKGVNKGEAVLFLEKYLAYPHSHTYAAGDADNDIPMIESAGHGIAMQNASEKVKESAEIITALDNDHNGLIEIIDKFFD